MKTIKQACVCCLHEETKIPLLLLLQCFVSFGVFPSLCRIKWLGKRQKKTKEANCCMFICKIGLDKEIKKQLSLMSVQLDWGLARKIVKADDQSVCVFLCNFNKKLELSKSMHLMIVIVVGVTFFLICAWISWVKLKERREEISILNHH